jgi:hypothetical protein
MNTVKVKIMNHSYEEYTGTISYRTFNPQKVMSNRMPSKGRDIACETECRQNDDNAYRKEFRQKDDYCNQANTGQARASYPYENPEP